MLHVFQRRMLPASSTRLGYPPLSPPCPYPQPKVWVAIATRMVPRQTVLSCGVGLVFTGNLYPAQRFRIEVPTCSNERGAISGLLSALRTVATDASLVIALENRAVVAQFTKRLSDNVASGWLATGTLAPIYRAAAAALTRRSLGTQFVPFRTHALHVEALSQANAARSLPPRETVATTHTSLALRGRPLATLTQGSAQLTLIASQKVPERKSTVTNIGLAIQAAGDAAGVWPTPARVWSSIRSRDIHRPTREFLWKLIHGAYKVGAFWLHVQDHEDKARCTTCGGTIESMQHILVECTAPGQKLIWELTAELSGRAGTAWKIPTLGSIMSSSLTGAAASAAQRRDFGAQRRQRILISEAAFLIWRLRCERVIQHENDPAKFATDQEIVRRWRATIQRRIRLDLQFTNRRRFGPRTLSLASMRATWEPILHPGSDPPPDNWWGGTGFLVRIWDGCSESPSGLNDEQLAQESDSSSREGA